MNAYYQLAQASTLASYDWWITIMPLMPAITQEQLRRVVVRIRSCISLLRACFRLQESNVSSSL